MSKRRRTFAGRAGAARPIDKDLIFIELNDVNATQQRTELFAATTACTILGIRWSLFVEGDAGSVGLDHDFEWIIVKRNDGEGNENNMNRTNAASFYQPEQDVLAFYVGTSHASASATTGLSVESLQGTTKTMRKMKVGDRIIFSIRGMATETVRIRGVVQLFCKT